MFRTCCVGFFLLIAFTISGQNQPNPFDLKYRPAKPKSNSVVPPSKPDSIAKSPQVVIDKPIQLDIKTDTSASFSINKDTGLSISTNPFEIDNEADTNSLAVGDATLDEANDIISGPLQSLKKRPSKGIQIFFLLLSLLFLIFVVNVERSFVKDLWRVISNENYSSLHLRNQRNTMRQILLLMGYSVFIIQAGIFLYHTLDIFKYQGKLFDNVLTCMALVLMVYLVRHSLIRYLRWLFNNDKEMTLFSFDISIFNIMVGLVLLPINVIINFGPESLAKPLIIIGLIVAIIAYFMRQLRWMLTARHLITNSLFLFFVYLCAVEILPLWAISKFFW